MWLIDKRPKVFVSEFEMREVYKGSGLDSCSLSFPLCSFPTVARFTN